MIKMELKIVGLKELTMKIQGKASELPLKLYRIIRDCALLNEAIGKYLSPIKTGRLRSSITSVDTSEMSFLEYRVGSNVEYAPFQEFGTKFMRGKLFISQGFRTASGKMKEKINQLALELK